MWLEKNDTGTESLVSDVNKGDANFNIHFFYICIIQNDCFER